MQDSTRQSNFGRRNPSARFDT